MCNNTVRAQKFKWQVFEPGEEEKVGRCTQQQGSEAGEASSNASISCTETCPRSQEHIYPDGGSCLFSKSAMRQVMK